ncbi:hypothetical protein FACS189443_6660 [Planctomycetales bacterium]|nr:hypothetical protein FACS189443_6660 [Planctomycetales bacterium]
MFDTTIRCNLNCSYCFKKKGAADILIRTAQDAIVWLVYASGAEKDISVYFMGGEPLLRQELIKQVVPFGRQRCKAHGKEITFGITTNTTLATDEFVEYATNSDIGFQLSLDGVPEVQNDNRPLADGSPSSVLTEIAIPKILKKQPYVMARACLAAANAGRLQESFHYFRNLGFTSIGFFPCEMDGWSEGALETYEQQLGLLGGEYIQAHRDSSAISLQPLERWFSQKPRENRGTIPCGSGRGLVLIDTDGGIWSCSRFNSFEKETWRLGSIYGNFEDDKRSPFMSGCSEDKFYAACTGCIAAKICEGGCLAENYEKTGDIYRMHPNDCEINRIHARIGTKVHDILYGEKNPLFMEKYYPQEWKELEKENNNDIPNEPCPA